MRRKRLLWQIYPSYLFITAITLVAVSWYAFNSLTSYFQEQLDASLQAEANLVAQLIQLHLGEDERDELLQQLRAAGESSGAQIDVIAPGGHVIADSRPTLVSNENQLSYPEIARALRGEVGSNSFKLANDGGLVQVVAVPVLRDGEVVAAVRVARPARALAAAREHLFLWLALIALVMIVLAVVVSSVIAKRIARPLRELKHSAEAIAQGNLESRVPLHEYEEVSGLANSMNRMAQQLTERFRTVQQQRLEQETIVSSMVEGVVAIDRHHKVLSMNKAAAHMLNLKPAEILGREIIEVIRNTDLQRFITQALEAGEPLEGDVTLVVDQEELFVQVHGTQLRNPDGEMFGALIVLNDITRLRKLENVRRDFVANVSHELKTPITSIKGFVETLIDTADLDSEEAKRFLQIISRQANRLHAIIEDLLKLSRIEQGIDRGEIELEVRKIKPVLSAAIHACEPHVSARNMKVQLLCDAELRARINAPLLEQAIVNLVDNAAKYGTEGQVITIAAEVSDDLAIISVADQGPGIEKEHLPRLFERFYRVDRARSSSQGGTGLGLAIVKHITISHGGAISVESELGKGTRFLLKLARR